MSDPNRDKLLNHEVDGIREFDNALPKWWLYGFYFTIAFAVVYWVNYHVLPEPFYGHKTIQAEWEADVADAAVRFPTSAGVGGSMVALTDAASLAKGEEIFNGMRNLCHTCHRKDLGGVIGPNLTDDQWMHGCTVSEMANNIKTGFPVKGMLPYGSGQPLTDEELLQVVSYIVAKRGTNPASPKAVDAAREKECR
ncbi:MAG: cbb3-type cytochrome c oxidase N-terminal domain-containing protein [Vicinamibacterales bacterium]